MRELRYCPPEYQAVLTEAGGLNPYGEPMFKLAWSGTETMRAGGYWPDGFVGYRDILARNGPQCWMVMQWEPAGHDGSPWLYYWRHRDSSTRLCDVGEYPFFGRYNIVRPLIWSGKVGSEYVHEHLELTGFLLSVLVPHINAWQQLSLDKRKLAIQHEEDLRIQELDAEVREALKACRPKASSRAVAAKVEFFETHWREVADIARAVQQQGRGFKKAGD